MTDRTTTTLGDLVAERPTRARALEKLGLDYCCGGQRSLKAACADAGVALEDAIAALDRADADPANGAEPDWRSVPVDVLAQHVLDTHHVFLRDEMPRIDALLEKVANVHGANHPELIQVRRVYTGFQDEMYAHLSKEENILFPMIRQLALAHGGGFHCGSIGNPIRVMLMEHDSAGDALRAMRELTKDYTAPADGCASYRALMDALAGLESDTHRHIHLENNVLFPRVVEIEAVS